MALGISYIVTGDSVTAQMADAWRAAVGSTYSPSEVDAAHGPVFGSCNCNAVRNIATAELAAACAAHSTAFSISLESTLLTFQLFNYYQKR